jgi:hypothetical protein
MIVVSSSDPSLRDRGGESFLLSPLYCGSGATGWRRTDRYAAKSWRTNETATMTLATAMAISGAAANPHTGVAGRGMTRSAPMGLLMALLNIRLGYFEVNPNDQRRRRLGPARPNHISPGIASLAGLGGHEKGHFVELSDGGHFENLGLYELLRREVSLILCSDGGADPDFAFADLANAIERARVDFGINVDFVAGFEHEKLAVRRIDDRESDRPSHADPGFALADIYYAPRPSSTSKGEKRGLLVYLKATMIANLPADLIAYRSAHPDFPHETTADQFFDEAQFEAYRELGYRIGRNMLEHPRIERLLGARDADPVWNAVANPGRIEEPGRVEIDGATERSNPC